MKKPVSKYDLITELMKFLDHTVPESELAGAEQGQMESVSETTFKITSDERIENMPEFIRKLESEILPLWEKIKESAVINDIGDFARQAKELTESYNYLPLVSWISNLEKQINTFDTDMIHEALGKFPEIIKHIKKQ